MTPEQVALVQPQFCQVALISEAAAVLFYDRLFDIAPQMRAMFPDDMIEQRRKLMAMLATVVKGLGNLEQVLPAASALAKRHVSYGVKAEHYPVVGAALLWTLEKGLGDGWTPEVADAWGTAYGTLSGYMISEGIWSQRIADGNSAATAMITKLRPCVDPDPERDLYGSSGLRFRKIDRSTCAKRGRQHDWQVQPTPAIRQISSPSIHDLHKSGCFVIPNPWDIGR